MTWLSQIVMLYQRPRARAGCAWEREKRLTKEEEREGEIQREREGSDGEPQRETTLESL